MATVQDRDIIIKGDHPKTGLFLIWPLLSEERTTICEKLMTDVKCSQKLMTNAKCSQKLTTDAKCLQKLTYAKCLQKLTTDAKLSQKLMTDAKW